VSGEFGTKGEDGFNAEQLAQATALGQLREETRVLQRKLLRGKRSI
jgi:hypothetical protein